MIWKKVGVVGASIIGSIIGDFDTGRCDKHRHIVAVYIMLEFLLTSADTE